MSVLAKLLGLIFNPIESPPFSVGLGFVCAVTLAVVGSFVALGSGPILFAAVVCCGVATVGCHLLDVAAS